MLTEMRDVSYKNNVYVKYLFFNSSIIPINFFRFNIDSLIPLFHLN